MWDMSPKIGDTENTDTTERDGDEAIRFSIHHHFGDDGLMHE